MRSLPSSAEAKNCLKNGVFVARVSVLCLDSKVPLGRGR